MGPPRSPSSSLRAMVALSAAGFAVGATTGSTAGRWFQIPTTGGSGQPKPSMAHVAGAFTDGAVVVFGGCTSSCCFAPIDTMWELSLSSDGGSGVWREVTPPHKPSPRFSAASAVVVTPSGNNTARHGGSKQQQQQQEHMYLFGGQDSSQAFLDDLWSWDHQSQSWEQLLQSPHSSSATGSSAPGGGGGGGPSARAGHTLSLLDTHYLVLYGGFGADGVLGDMWALDLQQAPLRWTRIQATTRSPSLPSSSSSPEPPPKRSGHLAVPLAGMEGALAVFGGFNEEGMDQDSTFIVHVDVKARRAEWVEHTRKEGEEGQTPPARHGAVVVYSGVSSSSSHGDNMVVKGFTVLGGVNTTTDTLPSSFLDDAYSFDVDQDRWTAVADDSDGGGGRLSARAYASVAYKGGRAIVFGGFAGYTGDTDDRLLDDVWLYEGAAENMGHDAATSESRKVDR